MKETTRPVKQDAIAAAEKTPQRPTAAIDKVNTKEIGVVFQGRSCYKK